MRAVRYAIPSLAPRRTTARAVLAALLARGARPLVFTRTTADASVLASCFGLPLLDPAWSPERVFAQIRDDDPPPGLVATLASVTGWRAAWATDVLIVDPPTWAELAQAETRAARHGGSGSLLVGIVHEPGDRVCRLLHT